MGIALWAPVVAAVGLVLPAPEARARQADPKAFDGLDSRKIDEAIDAGVASLKRLKAEKGDPRTDELVLWTFLHAGVAADDPLFQEILARVLKDPLEATYNVSLQAMLLEKLDADKHLPRLYECAQFLADNQLQNGQWSYGEPIKPVTVTLPARAAPRPAGTSVKPARRIPVVQRSHGSRPHGDFSNSQYAALGLRACHDAGFVFPRKMIEEARSVWVKSQHKKDEPGGRAPVATGVAAPQGWCYRSHDGGGSDPAYGSMTAGGVSSVIVYDHILGIDRKKDPAVLSGLAWLAKHFTVRSNPEWDNAELPWHYYYLYSLERAGSLNADEKIGPHFWYREGALFLLDAQGPGGSWSGAGNGGWGKTLTDTCFAILFLRRATKPVDVASVDRLAPKR
jgi:hypothetical protein